MEINNFKICTICSLKLSATTEFWHVQKAGKYGLRSVCKTCTLNKMKEYKSLPENKERHRLNMIKWRKVNTEKVVEIRRKSNKIHSERHNEERRERYKKDEAYRLKCKERELKYKESGRRRELSSKPEYKADSRLRSRLRREDDSKKQHDYCRNAKWREENKEYIQKYYNSCRDELHPIYIARTMRLKVKELTPEIVETKQIIIKLKRELRNNNIKIR